MELQEPPNQEPVEDINIPGRIESGNENKSSQLSQSRSAIISAVIIILIIDLLGILFIISAGDNLQIQKYHYTSFYHVILSVIIDIFLAIFILLGKKWARTWMLVRLVLGVIVWGFISIAAGDYGSLVMTTGVLLSLIILLTGKSTRIRTAMGIFLAVVGVIGGITLSLFGTSMNLPLKPEISIIPSHFSTYTSEGFFSISYPPDWSPEMSIIAEVERLGKQYIAEELGMESSADNYQMVFLGGNFSDRDKYVCVSVIVEPKNLWPLETIVESNHQWSLENIEQYIEYSRIKTTIDSRKAIIQNYQGLDIDSNSIRYTAAYVAGDKFIWTVLCFCENIKFDVYCDTFDQVVRSLRIEY